MNAASSISQIASLMADPKRSAMLWALIDGTPRLANELAIMTGLTSSSACAHLSLLSSAGLLRHEARGRKRYFRLATPQVGAAVEALASVQLESARGSGPGRRYHHCPCRCAGRAVVAITWAGSWPVSCIIAWWWPVGWRAAADS
ncbi:hypothetical protein GLGCALEP_00680 [Pseudomonas sp. MM221]|nr:hypothetical protein GLGCALEP_00680 [Pseudomonas sp. MM221]